MSYLASRRVLRIKQQLSTTEEQKSPMTSSARSPITTHILDTSIGRPAAHVRVDLFQQQSSSTSRSSGHKEEETEFIKIGEGETNEDGRVPDLLPTDHVCVVQLSFL